MQTIVVLLLLLGTGLSLSGSAYFARLGRTYIAPSRQFGLVLFSSPYVGAFKRIADVSIGIDQIDPVTNRAVLYLSCLFRTEGNFSELIFGAQIPYGVSYAGEHWIHVHMTETESGSGYGVDLGAPVFLNYSAGVENRTGLSYFWVIVNRTRTHDTYYDQFRFNSTLTLESPLFQKSYSVYEMVNQFDSATQAEIRNLVPNRMVSFLTPLNSLRYLLKVARASDSFVSADPAADAIDFSDGKLWYTWDIGRRSDDHFFATAIMVDFEIASLVEQRERTVFFASILLGVGIPLIISSLVELFKLRIRAEGDPFARRRSGHRFVRAHALSNRSRNVSSNLV